MATNDTSNVDEVVNPYQAPQAEEIISEQELNDLDQMDFKRLKKLYMRSHNVSSIAGLMILGLVFMAWLTFGASAYTFPVPVFLGLFLFYSVTITGIILRTNWGKVLCIIACVLMFFGGGLSILIGIAGLFACFGSPQLFGPDRITHAELKTVYVRRKKSKK